MIGGNTSVQARSRTACTPSIRLELIARGPLRLAMTLSPSTLNMRRTARSSSRSIWRKRTTSSPSVIVPSPAIVFGSVTMKATSGSSTDWSHLRGVSL